MIKIPKTKAFVAALVGIITFIVFIPALQNEFLGDDFGYVVKNEFIRSIDLNLFESAFLSFQHANWHPLTWISHALDYAAWELNPFGHHLTNNILHALNAFLVVFLVVRLLEAALSRQPSSSQVAQLSGNDSTTQLLNFSRFTIHISRFTLISAAITGLLFGLHPLRVEAVAWVAERKELLCGLFFLLSLMAYVRYADSIFLSFPRSLSSLVEDRGNPSEKGLIQGKIADKFTCLRQRQRRPGATRAAMTKPGQRFFNKWYLLTLSFFILALLSKPMAITLPFVLLILDWYPFRRINSIKTFLSALAEKIPFISLSIIASILTVMAQEKGGTIISTETISLSTRGLVAAKSLFAYLWKMMLPLNLMPAGYPYPDTIDVTILSAEYLLWIVLLTGITITSVVIAKKQQFWLSVWMYYFVTLVPVLGIVKAGGMFMADRYSYLPSLGPSLVVGLLTAGILEKILLMKRRRLLIVVGGVTAGIAILISLSLITIKQIGPWKNDASIMDSMNRIRLEKAMTLFKKARVFEKKGQLDKAIKEYQAALTKYPAYPDARLNLGTAYLKSGLLDEAIEQYQFLVELQPFEASYRNALGFAYKQRGYADKAIEQYKAAVQLAPSNHYYGDEKQAN